MIVTKSDNSEDRAEPVRWLDGVLQMCGAGTDMWAGEDPDEYVRKLRDGWE